MPDTLQRQHIAFSEVQEISDDYINALNSPLFTGAQYGCSCGCGGDMYTQEQWDSEISQARAAVKAAQEFCMNFGVRYNGVVLEE